MTMLSHGDIDGWLRARARGKSVYWLDLVRAYQPMDDFGESPYYDGLGAKLAVEKISWGGNSAYSVSLLDDLWDGGFEGAVSVLYDFDSAWAEAEKQVSDWVGSLKCDFPFEGLLDADEWLLAEGRLPVGDLTPEKLALAIASGTSFEDGLVMADWPGTAVQAESFLRGGHFRPSGRPVTMEAREQLETIRSEYFVPQLPKRDKYTDPFHRESMGELVLSSGPRSSKQTLYVSVGHPMFTAGHVISRNTVGDRYYIGITKHLLALRDKQHFVNPGDRWLDTDLNSYCTWDAWGTDEEVKTLEAWLIHSFKNSYGYHVENSDQGMRRGHRLISQNLAFSETESAVDEVIRSLRAKELVLLEKAKLVDPYYARDMKWDHLFSK